MNDDFTHKLVAKVRRLTGEARQQGISALILVEPIGGYSMRGARIQGTLQRARRVLKNLATYEDTRSGRA